MNTFNTSFTAQNLNYISQRIFFPIGQHVNHTLSSTLNCFLGDKQTQVLLSTSFRHLFLGQVQNLDRINSDRNGSPSLGFTHSQLNLLLKFSLVCFAVLSSRHFVLSYELVPSFESRFYFVYLNFAYFYGKSCYPISFKTAEVYRLRVVPRFSQG